MTSVAQPPPLRGETAQAVASATAHRAALWPAMVEMAARKPAPSARVLAARVVYFGHAPIKAVASAACPSAASATPLYLVTHSLNTALVAVA